MKLKCIECGKIFEYETKEEEPDGILLHGCWYCSECAETLQGD
jgi:predicted  nucleic acid-binding Zn-ribbon protein